MVSLPSLPLLSLVTDEEANLALVLQTLYIQ